MTMSFHGAGRCVGQTCLAAMLAALSLDLATAIPAAARSEPASATRAYDIPATDLGEALQTYGRLSNAQLLFSPALVRGRRSHAVNGRLSADDALKRLLSGSGLVFSRTSGNVILITGQAAPPSPAPSPPAPPVARPDRPQPPADRRDDDQVETVVIVAGKRPELLQSVPSSVLVATSSAMDRGNIRDFDDMVKIAPSLTITKTSQPANNSINIRGIGTYSYSIATEPSVAVVIDDVPQPFQAAAFTALVDVQQVEVLRGPQSTLFGKSASAGVVNITTQPATDTFTAKVETTVTSDNEQRLQGTVSGPIGDRLKFRLAGNYSRYRGNIYNLSTGHWLNGQSDTTARGKLVWTPADDWTVTLSSFATRTKSSCCAGAETYVSPGITFTKGNIPQSVALNGITPGPDNRLMRMDVDAAGDAIDYGAAVKVVRQAGGFRLASITSLDRYKLVDMQDTDSTDFDFSTLAPTAPHGGSANGGYFKIRSVTQEFRLTSPDSGRLKYVAGLFYSDTRAQRYFVRGSNTLGTYNGLPALPSTNSTTYAAYLAQATATNYALFGQASYDLTPKLGLIGGLRINVEDIRYTFADLGNGVTYGEPECSTHSPTLDIETCNSDTAVTGRAGLTYHVSPNIMAFATWARGYKGLAYDLSSTLTTRSLLTSGPLTGTPVADAVAAKQPIRPELVDSYELGFKSTLFDRHVLWNITAFHESFTGFQAQSRDIATGQNILNSIGRVTSAGVESEVSARFGHLSLNAAGAWNKATMDDFPNATCHGGQTVAQGCVGGVQDLSGKPLFNAPEWNITTGLFYERPWRRDWSGFVGAGYRWQSSVVFNLLQDPDSVQKAHGIANLSVGAHNDRWKVTLFVNNLFDQAYALTRGRQTHWNISQSLNPPTNATNWKPARDGARYAGIRFTATY